MSTYYSFYLFAKKDVTKGFTSDNFIYCGPYNQKGIPVPINEISGNNDGGIIRNLSIYLNEDTTAVQNTFKILQKKLEMKDSIFKRGAYYLALEDLWDIKDVTYKQGYVHKSIMRDIEINQYDIDLNELLLSDDDNILCSSEYSQLSPQEKKNYIFHTWKNESDEMNLKNSLLAVAHAWFSANIEYYKEFKGIDYQNLYFVIPC